MGFIIFFFIILPILLFFLFRKGADLVIGKPSQEIEKINNITINETNYITHNQLNVNGEEFHRLTGANHEDFAKKKN